MRTSSLRKYVKIVNFVVMSKMKKGELIGVADSTGKMIAAGDFLKVGESVIQVYGKTVKIGGSKVKVSDLQKK